jgi:hypothetical protein
LVAEALVGALEDLAVALVAADFQEEALAEVGNRYKKGLKL